MGPKEEISIPESNQGNKPDLLDNEIDQNKNHKAESNLEAPFDKKDSEIESTLTVEGHPQSLEGGEWDLLNQKLVKWFFGDSFKSTWKKLKFPLKIFAFFISTLFVLKIYEGILSIVEGFPLASGLFELVGVIKVAQFSAKNLIKTSKREHVFEKLRTLRSKIFGQ